MAWTSSDPETNQLLSALPIDLADVATSDDTPPVLKGTSMHKTRPIATEGRP